MANRASSGIATLDQLFKHGLRDIYYAEKQIEKALPRMIEKVSAPALKAGLRKSLIETRGHIDRVETVFAMCGLEARQVDCPAMDGILEEAEELTSDVSDAKVLDAALLAAAQAAEHYQITRYGTLMAWLRHLDHHDCAAILELNLREAEKTDRSLTRLAEGGVNLDAA